MGEKNTISLLSSISSYLKLMAEQAQQNKGPEKTQATMTKNLNQGSVLSGAATKQAGKGEDILISAATMAVLNTLPSTILAIGKLKKKDVEAFTKTLLAIQVTLNKFAEGTKEIKGANSVVKIVSALSDLEKVGLIKLATSLKMANMLGLSKSLEKFVNGVAVAAKKAGNIKKSDLNNLKSVSNNMKAFASLTKGLALVMGTVIAMAVAIKVIGTGPILKSVGLTLGVLTALSTIAIGVGILAKRITSGTRGLMHIAKFILLMQGAVIGTLLVGMIAQQAWPQILKGFGVISGIILGYTAVAALASFLFNFININRVALTSVMLMAAYGMAITLGTLLVGTIAQEAWPDILKGFGIISGIILGYTAVAGLASFLHKFISVNKAGLLTVTLMAGYGIALTLGTLLMGAIAEEAWPDILIGFGTVSGIILGYTAIVTAVSKIAKLSPTFKKDILNITLMAGISMGLVLGTLLMGAVAEEAWPDILIGFTTMSLLMEGFAGLARLVSITAKGIGKFKQDFITLGIFAAECAALLLGTVAIAWITKKSGVTVGEIVLTLAGIGAIATGLMAIAIKLKVAGIGGSKKAIATLKELTLIGFACEALLAGVIGLAILAKKADPKYIAATISMLGGIVYGLIKVTQYLELHNKSLAKGAKNLLLVEAVALGAEAILAGAIILANHLDDPKLAYQIPITIALISGIILGVVELTKLVEKHNKDLSTGVKLMLLVEAVALGAEAILGGILGLIWLKEKTKASELEIIGVTALIGGIVIGLVSVLKLIEKHNKDLQKGAKSMLLVEAVALGAEAILAGAIGIVVLAKKTNTNAGEIAAVIGAVGLIVVGLVQVLKQVEKHNKELQKGAKSLLIVVTCAAGAGLVLAETIGIEKLRKVAGVEWSEIGSVMAAMTGIITAFGLLAGVAGKFDKQVKKGIKSIALIELLALGAGLLLTGVIGIVALKNLVKATWEDVFITIGAMATIVTAFGVLAAAVGLAEPFIAPALPGVGIISLFALASEALLAGVIGLIALKNQVKAEWDDVFITIGAMATVVTAFGVLAAAVGLATPFIVPALPGVGIISLFALASEALLAGVIGLIALKNQVKTDFEEIFTTIGAMATIVGAFGALGTAVGVAAPLITLGLASVGVITLFAGSAELLLAGVIGLVDLKNKAKASWDDVDTTLSKMEKIVEDFGKIGLMVGVVSPIIATAILSIPSILGLGKSSASILESVISIIDKKNKAKASWDDIDTTLTKMENVIKEFGDIAKKVSWAFPFIKAGASGLSAAIKMGNDTAKMLQTVIATTEQTKKLGNDGWNQIDKTLSLMQKVLVGDGSIPGFKQISEKAFWSYPFIVRGAKGLTEVTKTATATAKSLIEMCKAAESTKKYSEQDILLVISRFDSVTNKLKEMVGGNFPNNARAIANSKNLINSISTISMDVAAALANMAGVAKEGGLMRTYRVKPSGDIAYGPWVNARGSAETIASTISYFVNTLYDTFDKIDKDSAERLIKGTEVMQKMIDPVSKFATTLTSFQEAGEGKIRVIKYDEKGKLINTPAVDVASVATSIGSAVSTFCNTLFSESNATTWENMAKGGSFTNTTNDGGGVTGTVYNPGYAHQAMGVFASIVDPVSNFAQTLAMFEDTNGEGELLIPVYDKDGNLTNNPRKINVVNVADKIGNAVTTFMKTLNDKSADWRKTYEDSERSYTTTTTTTKKFLSATISSSSSSETHRYNVMEDAYKIFSMVMQPIISFTNTLAMFTTENNKLKILGPDGTFRDLDVVVVANSIGEAVSTFIKSLSSQISSLSTGGQFSILEKQQQNIETVVGTFGKIFDSMKDIDGESVTKSSTGLTDIFKLVDTYSSPEKTKLFQDTSSNVGLLVESIDNLGSSIEVKGEKIKGMFISLASSLTTITSTHNQLSNIIVFLEKLETHAQDVSNVISSKVITSLTNFTSTLPTLSTPLSNAKDSFDKTINDKNKGVLQNVNKTTAAFNRSSISIKNFDDALNGNQKNRIKNINSITDAVNSLNNATTQVEGKLSAVAEVLTALAQVSSNASANNIERLVTALGNMRIGGGGGYSGGGGGASINEQSLAAEISKAIAKAFDGTEIRLKERQEGADKSTAIKQIRGYLDLPGANNNISTNYEAF